MEHNIYLEENNVSAQHILSSYVPRSLKNDDVVSLDDILSLGLPETKNGNKNNGCKAQPDALDINPKTYLDEKVLENFLAKCFKYNMDYPHRGCFVIFNQEEFDPHLQMSKRNGTELDVASLVSTAKTLGFEFVKVFQNLKREAILEWIGALSTADHSSYDCFVCAILTHGGENDVLYAQDQVMKLSDFTKPFNADRCASLAGKPKLFFVQACRGFKLDTGYRAMGATMKKLSMPVSKKEFSIPAEADFLIACSTVPGYYSWRNEENGSWFIQCLCKCLQDYYSTSEIMQIMIRVNRMVAFCFESYQDDQKIGHKQIPSITTRFTSELYFNPKIKTTDI